MTSPRMRGLGRGLDALIPMSREGEAMVPQMIAVDQIRPSYQQVRSRFDAEPLGELAESIRLHGVLQPLLVRRIGTATSSSRASAAGAQRVSPASRPCPPSYAATPATMRSSSSG